MRHVYDGSAGVVANTALALYSNNLVALLDGGELGFSVSESAQGADLNGDGDTSDAVFFQRDFQSGAIPDTMLVASASSSEDVALAPEYANGDRNGDGDTLDVVPYLLRPGAAPLSLGVASSEVRPSDGWVALLVSESEQGTDLNGDGDTLDRVLQAYERATGVLTNLGLTPSVWALAGRVVGCALEEAGVADWNGDGDTTDRVIHWVDLKTGTVVNLGLATGSNDPLWLSNDLFAFVVEEDLQGQDLDGNGLVEAVGVVHVVSREHKLLHH